MSGADSLVFTFSFLALLVLVLILTTGGRP